MKIISSLLCFLLVFPSIIGAVTITVSTNEIKFLEDEIYISSPIIKEEKDYLIVDITESESYLNDVGKPNLPVILKRYSFPINTVIKDIQIICENEKILLSKKIMPFSKPQIQAFKSNNLHESYFDESIYNSDILYPAESYSITKGSGIINDQRVLLLNIKIFPQYLPIKNMLYFPSEVKIKIEYITEETPDKLLDEYDLVIITPDEFSSDLQQLVTHKNKYNVNTFIKTTEEIYNEYEGRDNPEKIKYFIKDALDQYSISYVLLIGNIYKLPIRTSIVEIWDWECPTPTDMYYSDIYNSDNIFCTWDSNENNIFGETGDDEIDLLPDVHIGRIPCDTSEELNIVIDKIIHYETETYGENWFNNMIFMGGDTHSGGEYEGEVHNEIVMNIMSEFNPVVIWTSLGNFNRNTINEAINNGACFIDYSGHGFEFGFGTYMPNSNNLKSYYTRYLRDLNNNYRLPIIYFSACLTAKLDFTLSDLFDYKAYSLLRIFTIFPGIDENLKLPCFAWSSIVHPTGGGIASIGATRVAFGGDNFGCRELSKNFFDAYDNCDTLGQMHSSSIIEYATEIDMDELTPEEFILIGDPSLKIGGYP